MHIRVRSLALGVILLAGCATSSGPGVHAGDPYIVNTQRTMFYSYGPSQPGGADLALYHGQRVTMLSRAFGYSQVTIKETGQTGYVSTEDLVPAPPEPRPSPAPDLFAALARHHRRRVYNPAPGGDGPQHIPLPEFPESKPPPDAPSFRY